MSALTKSYILALKVVTAMLLCSSLLIWLNHGSINLYWQQKYHKNSPLEVFDTYPVWQFGGQITQALVVGKIAFMAQLFAAAVENEPLKQTQNEPTPPPVSTISTELTLPNVVESEEDALITRNSVMALGLMRPPAVKRTANDYVFNFYGHNKVNEATNSSKWVPSSTAKEFQTVALAAEDEVFFVGDSMMQGIAPHVANKLQKTFGIQSTNLSKQSTGLAYQGFFNWPETVRNTLEKNKNIRLMVVFLGPNDPWDIPRKKGEPYLHFKSEEWEAAYRDRVDELLATAQLNNVKVIWIGVPNMRKKELSSAMRYLNQLYLQENVRFHQRFITTNDVLGYTGELFDPYIQLDNNKRVKVRTDDGIHFTVDGQKRIADKVLSLIEATPQDANDSKK